MATRFIDRSALQISASATQVDVPTPNPTTPADFSVRFDGIISFIDYKPQQGPEVRRAAVVDGGIFSMRHDPVLSVDQVDGNSLRDLSGQTVSCVASPDPTKPPVRCAVRMERMDVRVVDEDKSMPTGSPIVIDGSFNDLIPHLYSRAALNGEDPALHGKISMALATSDFPSIPVAAYFEIADAGTLVACPFSGNLGRFTTTASPPVPLSDWAQFGNEVFWYGKTTRRAVLQIRSAATRWEWETVTMQPTSNRLIVTVRNQPADSSVHNTTTHFVLHGKLMPASTLSLIESKQTTPDCDGLSSCYVCSKTIIDVPGCSNSQWP